MLTQPNILLFGWVSLLAGLVIPSVASIQAMRLFWSGVCAGEILWGVFPLIVGCDPLSQIRLVTGWIATVICLAAFISAAFVAICAAVTFFRSPDKRASVAFLLFPIGVGVVAIVIVLTIVSNPDARSNARGSWIAFTSFAGLAAYVVVGIASWMVRFVVQTVDRPDRT